MSNHPNLLGVSGFIGDLEVSFDFHTVLGLSIERASSMYARATLPHGATIGCGTREPTSSYDPRWEEPTGPGTHTINFELASREAVDASYERLVAAGYKGHPLSAIRLGRRGLRSSMIPTATSSVCTARETRKRIDRWYRCGGRFCV